MSKLKRCPLCGGNAKVAHYSNGWDEWYHVICPNCHISQTGSHTKTEAEVIEEWNTRKPMDRIVERLEEEKGVVVIDGKPMYQEDCFIDIDDAIEIVKEEGDLNAN
jgi:hypothetical protein